MRRTTLTIPRFAIATASAALLAAGALASTASAAAPAQVPCPRDGKTNHYVCNWYPAGDGVSGGSPVETADGVNVGFLHQGRNWIVCQQRGSRVNLGKDTNVWWGWTTADDGKTGWANALYAQGGGNDGQFKGVPNCGGAHGSAPVVAATTAPPTTTVPTAPAGPSRATLRAAVKAVEYERVYGKQYGKMKRRYPQGAKPNTIIWDNDGCSVPKAAYAAAGPAGALLLKKFNDDFQKSCDRHDFGYRNYGSADGGLRLDTSSSRRASIDRHFKSNMKYQCNKIYHHEVLQAAQREVCFKAADVFYEAVRHFGSGDFN